MPWRFNDFFHVGQVTPVVHYCMGGLSVSPSSQVLDLNGNPINGLWAAGEVMGGIKFFFFLLLFLNYFILFYYFYFFFSVIIFFYFFIYYIFLFFFYLFFIDFFFIFFFYLDLIRNSR